MPLTSNHTENLAAWSEKGAGTETSARTFLAASEALTWVCVLDEISNLLAVFNPSPEDLDSLNSDVVPSDALPFEEALAPFRDYVATHLQRLPLSFSASAARDLERECLLAISSVCGQTLLDEFASCRQSSLQASCKRHCYQGFVCGLWNGGWARLFIDFPVLGRLISTIICCKVNDAFECARRLEADRLELLNHFGANAAMVMSTETLGDLHNGMRSVRIVCFESGLRLVYKPKNHGLHKAWLHFASWVNIRSSGTLRVPAILARDHYAWMEFVNHTDCNEILEVSAFYERTGALLCLLYALRASDCHFENVIAEGSKPVLIDTETLLQPGFKGHSGGSVLDCGMLPQWEAASATQSVNAGGISFESAPVTVSKPSWFHVNTDGMNFGAPAKVVFSRFNMPTVKGVAVAAEAFVEDLQRGFSQTYRTLLAHQEEICDASGPLSAFESQPVRIVFRNTRIYRLVIACALRPEYLLSEAAFRERLATTIRNTPYNTYGCDENTLVSAEVEALASLDIPLFVTQSNSILITSAHSDCCLEYSGIPGLPAAMESLAGMNASDLNRQVALIRLSFRAASDHLQITSGSPVTQPEQPCEADDFRQEARRLGDVLIETAHTDSQGDITWLSIQFQSAISRYTVQPTGESLWDGRDGIALFLAALYNETGDERYRNCARAALVRNPNWRATNPGVGEEGIGSRIYCLTRAATWLNDVSLLDEACEVAKRVTCDALANDCDFDVMKGAAGCILALLVLDQMAPEAEALDAALLCANHLVRHQSPEPHGGAAWRNRAPQAAVGFAHGSSGIAYALSSLEGRRPDALLRHCAAQALAYQRARYSAVENRWFDVRSLISEAASGSGQSWCHGASGIGLAGLGIFQANGDRAVLVDIEAALCTSREQAPSALDHLCCGKFGVAEFLLQASLDLDRPSLFHEACCRASTMLHQARRSGGYRLVSGAPDEMGHPGLFTGIAGIGYQLLRLSNPHRFPSVLLFQ